MLTMTDLEHTLTEIKVRVHHDDEEVPYII